MDYKTIFDSAQDAIFVHPMGKEIRFTKVNRAAIERYGYTEEEFLNMGPQELDDEASSKIAPITKRIQKEGKALFETVHKTKEGKKIPVEINTTMINIEGRPMAVSFARDISKRREAERQLREKMEELQIFRDVNIKEILRAKELEEENKRLKEKYE